jgi:hypothetical protein
MVKYSLEGIITFLEGTGIIILSQLESPKHYPVWVEPEALLLQVAFGPILLADLSTTLRRLSELRYEEKLRHRKSSQRGRNSIILQCFLLMASENLFEIEKGS